ncbi:MAG: hypothetical protein PGN13_05245 [Patulibacter minatonensis]
MQPTPPKPAVPALSVLPAEPGASLAVLLRWALGRRTPDVPGGA